MGASVTMDTDDVEGLEVVGLPFEARRCSVPEFTEDDDLIPMVVANWQFEARGSSVPEFIDDNGLVVVNR